MNGIASNRTQEVPGFAQVDDGTVDRHAGFDGIEGPFQGFPALAHQFDMARVGEQGAAGRIGMGQRQGQELFFQGFQAFPGAGRQGRDDHTVPGLFPQRQASSRSY